MLMALQKPRHALCLPNDTMARAQRQTKRPPMILLYISRIKIPIDASVAYVIILIFESRFRFFYFKMSILRVSWKCPASIV